MRKLAIATTIIPILTMGAAAQDVPIMNRLNIPAKVMGTVVKGAPYSADEVTESQQVLADGTRISNQTKVTVYRDGEGRVRRENGNEVTIWDPVNSVSYTLNPTTMTAFKSSMGVAVSNAGTVKAQFFFTAGEGTAAPKASVEAQAVTQKLDQLKVELAASQDGMIVNGTRATPRAAAALKEDLVVAMDKAAKIQSVGKSESLGQQVMEGVAVEGTRHTSTIETGTIGNDRPINVVTERWYSSDLQTALMTKHTDPRTGEDSFRLENVRRGEPGADLFMVPAGYQIVDSGSAWFTVSKTKKEE